MVKASATVTITTGSPALGESFNISGSPIDNGVGDTTVNLATNMNSAGYQTFGSVSFADITFRIGRTSGSMLMVTRNLSGTPTDTTFTVSAIGEQ
jgi:hypothetical protein